MFPHNREENREATERERATPATAAATTTPPASAGALSTASKERKARKRTAADDLPEHMPPAFASEAVRLEQPGAVYRKFRDWHMAQGRTAADWLAAWRLWIEREHERHERQDRQESRVERNARMQREAQTRAMWAWYHESDSDNPPL